VQGRRGDEKKKRRRGEEEKRRRGEEETETVVVARCGVGRDAHAKPQAAEITSSSRHS